MKFNWRLFLLFLASGLLTGVALAHWANLAHSQAPPDSLENVRRDLTTNVRQVNAQGLEIANIQSKDRQQDIDIRILQEDNVMIRTNVGTWQSQHNDLKNLVEDRLQRIDALPVTQQGEAIAAVRESAGVNAEAITLMRRTLMAVDSDIGNMDIFNPDNPPSAEAIADWRGGVEDGSLPLAQRSLLHGLDIETNAEGVAANVETLGEHDTRIGTNAQNIGVLDRRTLGQADALELMDTTLVRLDESVVANLETLGEHDTRIGANASAVAANAETLGEHDTRITANAEGVAANKLSIGDMGILDRREVENEDGEMVAAIAMDPEQLAAMQESYDQGTADVATNLYVNRERLDKHDALINTNIENIGILDDRTLAHGETLKSHGATLEKHGERLDAVEDGVSMSMALSALDTRPATGENFRVGAGVGMAGSAALAVGGTGRIAKHGAWNLGVSTTGEEVGARVGLNWGF